VQSDDQDAQIKRFADWVQVHLGVFRTAVTDIAVVEKGFADANNEKARKLLAQINPWVDMYSVSPAETAMRIAQKFDLAPLLQGALTMRAKDASSARDKFFEHDPGLDLASSDKENVEKRALLLNALVPIERNLRCMVHYGITIAELISLGVAGSDGAFVQAVRIDPTSVNSTAMVKRLSRATLTSDRKFLRAIGNAIRLPTLGYEDVTYPDLRFVLGMLDPVGVFKQLGVSGTYILLAERLQVYPTEGSDTSRDGDQARSLWQFIARWRQEISTKRRRRM
jgi:hypothetical protein